MTKAELLAAIAAAAEELGETVEVDDNMTNNVLEGILEGLEAKKGPKPADDTPDDSEGDEATAAAEAKKAARLKGKKPAVKKPPFYVAPGKSLTTKRGILSGDDVAEIKADDLPGGEAALNGFVASGHVQKG